MNFIYATIIIFLQQALPHQGIIQANYFNTFVKSYEPDSYRQPFCTKSILLCAGRSLSRWRPVAFVYEHCLCRPFVYTLRDPCLKKSTKFTNISGRVMLRKASMSLFQEKEVIRLFSVNTRELSVIRLDRPQSQIAYHEHVLKTHGTLCENRFQKLLVVPLDRKKWEEIMCSLMYSQNTTLYSVPLLIYRVGLLLRLGEMNKE
jgi:hypothetical protein